jgi:hypothetical protein
MKRATTTLLLIALGLTAPVLADDAHHAQPAPDAAAAAPEQTVKALQDNLRTMQTQLDRAAQAESDDVRQKVLAEYMQTMQESMKMARGMQAGMKGCPMMEDGMMGGGKDKKMGGMGMKDDGTAGRMHHMEKRMDMMQLMLEQMLRRQDTAPAK